VSFVVIPEQQQIIDITHITGTEKLALDEVVQRVEIDIGPELARDRPPLALRDLLLLKVPRPPWIAPKCRGRPPKQKLQPIMAMAA
jgi:hypothetical protein